MPGWFRRLRARIRYRHFEHDLVEELALHRAMKEDALRSEGVGGEEARWRATRELGNVTMMRENARAVWIAPWLESVWQDVRYAVRNLRKHPGFTLAATATLVLGIGLNASLFTVFNALTLRPWPVADAGSVVRVLAQSRATQGRSDGISIAEYRFLQQHAVSFAGLVAIERAGAPVGEAGSTQVDYLQTCFVTANFFDVLGVAMEAGRGFAPDEGVFGAPRWVVVISDRLWRGRFAAAPDVIGRRVIINQQPFTIVGVASRRFTGPDPVRRYDLLVPLPALPLVRPNAIAADGFDNPEECCAEVVGRLAPDISREKARAEVEALSRRFRGAWKLRAIGVLLTGTAMLGQPATVERMPVFVLMFAAVFLVLLLACANVGNLQLARAAGRHREIAIRLAIGAGRWRLVRQLLTESLLLCTLAGAAAVGVAYVLPGILIRWSEPAGAPREWSEGITPDLTVLAFTLALSALAAVLSGLAPALRATRAGARVGAAEWRHIGPGRVRLRSILLATQIAASTVLLVSAGLLTRGVVNAMSSDLGFALNDVLVVQVTPVPGSGDASTTSGWFPPVIAALNGAGLGPAAVVDIEPLRDMRLSTDVRLPGERASDARSVRMVPATPDYFAVLRIPLVAGRSFDPRFSAREVVVNQTLARLLWPGQQAVGKTLIAGGKVTVVGVARDAHVTGFEAIPPILHRPPAVASVPLILVRHTGTNTEARVRAVLSVIDSRIGVAVKPLSNNLSVSLRNSISGATIAWAIGLLGLALAIVGVFGVFAYVVEERKREIGIRIALGARGAQVVRLILAQTRVATLGGLTVGFVLSLGAGQLLRAHLFGASPLDPLAYGGILAVLLVAAIVATYIPARRASRVDPALTLRCE